MYVDVRYELCVGIYLEYWHSSFNPVSSIFEHRLLCQALFSVTPTDPNKHSPGAFILAGRFHHKHTNTVHYTACWKMISAMGEQNRA